MSVATGNKPKLMDSFVTIKRRKMSIHRNTKVATRDGHIGTANTARISRDSYQSQYDAAISQWQIAVGNAIANGNNWAAQEESLLNSYTGPAGGTQNQGGFDLWYNWWNSRRGSSPGNLAGYHPFLPNWVSRFNQPRPHLQMTIASQNGIRFLRWAQAIGSGHRWSNLTEEYSTRQGYGLGWYVCNHPREYQHWTLRAATITTPSAPTRPWQINHNNNVMINNLQHASNQDVLISADNRYIGKLDTRGGEEIFDATKPGHNKEFTQTLGREIVRNNEGKV